MFRVKRITNPYSILENKERLIANIEAYFNGTEPPWLPNELARAIGFSSFNHLKRYLGNSYLPSKLSARAKHGGLKDGVEPPATHIPQDIEAFYILDQAFSQIEDDLLRGAILDEYKFAPIEAALSIYFDKAKVKKSEQHQEINQTTTNRSLKIVINQDNSPSSLQEVQRLKQITAQENPKLASARRQTADLNVVDIL